MLPWLRKAAEARKVSSVSLNGGLKGPFHEAVKLKNKMPWRPQEFKDSRGIGYLRKRCSQELELAQEKENVQSAKLNRAGDLKNILISDVKL